MFPSEEESDSLVEGFDLVDGKWVTSNRMKNMERNDDIMQDSPSATNGNCDPSQDTVKSLDLSQPASTMSVLWQNRY